MNKKHLIIIFVISLIISLVGCGKQERYKIEKGDDGTIYRIDKKTGEMAIIKDGKIIPLETPESKKLKRLSEIALKEPIDWGEQEISGKDLRVKTITSWRNGKVYYRLSAYPYSSLRKMYQKGKSDTYYKLEGHRFNIKFMDENSFVIKEIPVKFWDMTRVVDEEGVLTEISINSNAELNKDEYRVIAYCTVGWTLDMELIPEKETEESSFEKYKIKDALEDDKLR